MEEPKADPIEIRLNAVIVLLSKILTKQEPVATMSVYEILNNAGLQPSEISKMFGKSPGAVTSALTQAKKKSRSEKSKV